MCAAVTGRVSEVGEAGQSIVTGTGERLNVKWAAGVEEVSSDDIIKRMLIIIHCLMPGGAS